ncbi:fluoride efflux transporter CrcB [Halegenticoccus soli]|uniref:fluoride efflux transporter CrcB n=1 Tax=Halegenticoccus soli TaxID=1985678 RepID=UPI0018EC1AEF|nr:fluoride efflux transporter CrcB [Halegenticoccus soli]
MDPAHLLGTGGALGAVLRYLVGEAVPAEEFPVATLVVNVVGSFVLGLVTFGGVGGDVALFVGGGMCGAFTTYSSFSVQTVLLWERRTPLLAAVNAAGNLLSCVGAVWLARLLVG